jgi:hypothetical protein
MLNTSKSVQGFTLSARDGDIGSIEEFYFDDRFWTIRYLVAGTGGWLPGRQALLSPYALGAVNKDLRRIVVDLTKKQIESSPSLETDKPVSRQFEANYYDYYGWPMYWNGPFAWGSFPSLTVDRSNWKELPATGGSWDPHLRSTREVRGYGLHAADGDIGHVDDFIFDDETWTIRYLVVATHDWWPGKKVLISPKWIERVSWEQSKVYVDLPRVLVKKAPEYDGQSTLDRAYESDLHEHYRKQGYWLEESPAHAHSR